MTTPCEPHVQKALAQFKTQGRLVLLEPLGKGNINDTYLGTYEELNAPKRHYVHQRLNTHVFRDPAIVMGNMRTVTGHIQRKIEGGEDAPDGENSRGLRTLQLVSTRDSQDYVMDSLGSIWRTTNFLEGLVTHETLKDTHQAFEVGRCLGDFHALVSDLDTQLLGDSLPGFHHTEKYFEKFEVAVRMAGSQKLMAADRDLAALVDGLLARRSLANLFCDGIATGRLPLRTVHNDPKVSNFMFDPVTNSAVCLIDLDTVKPGLVHYDFGDCLRSATNPLGEESCDFEAVGVDVALFEALTRGYCSTARLFLRDAEWDLLVDSVRVLAFELAIRFLTSHLLADGYFKERYVGNNYNRALVQMRLVEDMEKKEARLKAIVNEFRG